MALSAAKTSSETGNVARSILIVDDDLDFAEGLDIALSSEGYDVTCANGSASAIDLIDTFQPGVALIDVRLTGTGSSGIDLIARLRERHAELLCVMITAYGSTDTAIKALQEGAYDYLTKPVHSTDLLATLDRCFERIELANKKAETEAALRLVQMRFQNLLDYSPVAFHLKGIDGCYWLVNQQFANWYGISVSDAIGKTPRDVFSEEFADLFLSHDRVVLETRELFEQECDVPFADGTIHRVIVTKYPVFSDDGQLIGIGGINTDITQIRQAEEQLRHAQKMEAVGQLTSGIAHDFNNILAVIQGSAELLVTKTGDETPLTDLILSAASRGSELTQRLLAFSLQQALQPQATDLGDLVSGMSELLTRTLGETINLQTNAEPGLWAASVDPGQVENAILNLALNARDAMPRGGSLTIECANVQLDEPYALRNPDVVPGDYVVLTVSDTGIGMSEKVQKHAFEPFFTTKEVGHGSGLGLSMIYGFAKQSGGHACIFSEQDKGTTVKLYLPRTEKPIKSQDARSHEDVPMGHGEVILVIEDDASVRTMTVRLLEELGYWVIGVSEAAGARKALADGEPVDLVLSDVVLPGGTSGPQFADETAKSHPDLKFIFMSGHSVEAAKRSNFLGAGKVLLSKPFQRQKLAIALREALD